jgi:glycerate kinase
MGKVISGIAKIAREHGKPVFALGGSVGDGAESLYDSGINAVFPIVQSPCTLEYAMNENNALQNLRKTARNLAKVIESMKDNK